VSSQDEAASPVTVAVPADGRALEERLTAIPPRPGVYLLKDRHGKVIYIGKAANLRSRVRSYVRGGDERSQIRFLVERMAEFETLVTANDKEALILENNLIKQYRPRYNIRLKDDKSYVSVKVSVQDPWPRVLVTRKIVKDGSRYFGPFASASAVRDTLDTIRKVFPLRTCSDPVFKNRSLRAPRRSCRLRGASPPGDAAARGPEPRRGEYASPPHAGGGRSGALRGRGAAA